MNKACIVALCVALAGCAQTTEQSAAPAKVETTAAANPNLPAGAPAWKQGLMDPTQQTALAPHPPKLTVTPVSEIPVNQIKVPPGFKVEIWASGMPGARM